MPTAPEPNKPTPMPQGISPSFTDSAACRPSSGGSGGADTVVHAAYATEDS